MIFDGVTGYEHEDHRSKCRAEERLEYGYTGHRSGSPNYLSELTAAFRALYERLIFQNLAYNMEKPCCNEHPIPVLLIMTSNAPDDMYQDLLQNYQESLSRFVGPTEVLVNGETLQLKDYSKTDWPLVDV